MQVVFFLNPRATRNKELTYVTISNRNSYVCIKIRKNVFFVPKNKGFSLRSTPKIKTKNQKIKTPGRVSFLYSHTRCITPRAS